MRPNRNPRRRRTGAKGDQPLRRSRANTDAHLPQLRAETPTPRLQRTQAAGQGKPFSSARRAMASSSDWPQTESSSSPCCANQQQPTPPSSNSVRTPCCCSHRARIARSYSGRGFGVSGAGDISATRTTLGRGAADARMWVEVDARAVDFVVAGGCSVAANQSLKSSITFLLMSQATGVGAESGSVLVDVSNENSFRENSGKSRVASGIGSRLFHVTYRSSTLKV